MRLLSYIVTILLFIGPPLLAILNFPVEGESGGHKYLYPAFYLLILYFFISFFKGNFFNKKINIYIFLIIATVFGSYVLLRLFYGRASKMVLFNSFALPALYALMYSSLSNSIRSRIKIQNLILLLFCANSLFAIYERITLHANFSFFIISSDYYVSESYLDDTVFRSSAFLGHPLTNALITSVVMGFILVSSMNIIKKYLLLILGFIALFCFNARGSIIFTAFFMMIYLLYPQTNMTKAEQRKRWIYGILFLALCGVGVLYLFQNGFGGRFFEHDVSEDSSILARLDAWNILLKFNWTYFLMGVPDIEGLAFSILGTYHVENWLILFILNVGLIITTIVILLFVPLFRLSLINYSHFQALIALGLCLCVSSTNNSLACGVPAISVFFACAYAFGKPLTQKQIDVTLLSRE